LKCHYSKITRRCKGYPNILLHHWICLLFKVSFMCAHFIFVNNWHTELMCCNIYFLYLYFCVLIFNLDYIYERKRSSGIFLCFCQLKLDTFVLFLLINFGKIWQLTKVLLFVNFWWLSRFVFLNNTVKCYVDVLVFILVDCCLLTSNLC